MRATFSALMMMTKSPMSMWGENVGLVLAAEENGGVAGETAENDVGGVDDDPVALDFASLGGVSARH